MIDKKLIEKKLRRIEEHIRELRLVNVATLEEFSGNTVARRFIERNIQLSIEQMVDICKHLVSALDLNEPETYAECFDILAGNRIIAKEHTDTFKAMARFRNILIHGYEDVEHSVTYAVYRKRLKDFRTFIKEIRTYLHAH
ncbi:MAG: DUF86 domain-containing protein [Nitrospirota bacterium]